MIGDDEKKVEALMTMGAEDFSFFLQERPGMWNTS